MKHEVIIAAHAPNCGCPRCRHWREGGRLRDRASAAFAYVTIAAGVVLIVLPALSAALAPLVQG